MNVNTKPISFIVYPVAFVNIAVDVNEFTLTKSSVVFPTSVIASPIWPCLFADSVAETPYPLTNVVRSRFENVDRSLFSFSIRVVWFR